MSSPPAQHHTHKAAVKLRSLLALHRRMGIISALFVMVLAASGLVLQHSSRLGLDTSFIGSDLMLGIYGLEAPPPDVSFSASAATVTLIGDGIFFNSTRLPGIFSSLAGMVATDFGFVIANRDQLVLVTADAEVVEILGSLLGVPPGIDRIGADPSGALWLETAGGVLAADLDRPAFTAVTGAPADTRWSQQVTLEPELAQQLTRQYARAMLNLERLLLDLHSGRLLGGLGVVLVDLMAILFLLMAATGVWIWTRRRAKRARR